MPSYVHEAPHALPVCPRFARIACHSRERERGRKCDGDVREIFDPDDGGHGRYALLPGKAAGQTKLRQRLPACDHLHYIHVLQCGAVRLVARGTALVSTGLCASRRIQARLARRRTSGPTSKNLIASSLNCGFAWPRATSSCVCAKKADGFRQQKDVIS